MTVFEHDSIHPCDSAPFVPDDYDLAGLAAWSAPFSFASNAYNHIADLADGTICRATFRKADGSERVMLFRCGVRAPRSQAKDYFIRENETAALKAKHRAWRAAMWARGFVPVFDMQKRDWRTLNPRTLRSLRIRGTEIDVREIL